MNVYFKVKEFRRSWFLIFTVDRKAWGGKWAVSLIFQLANLLEILYIRARKRRKRRMLNGITNNWVNFQKIHFNKIILYNEIFSFLPFIWKYSNGTYCKYIKLLYAYVIFLVVIWRHDLKLNVRIHIILLVQNLLGNR